MRIDELEARELAREGDALLRSNVPNPWCAEATAAEARMATMNAMDRIIMAE